MSILSVYYIAFLLILSGIFYAVPNRLKPYVLLVGNVYFYLQFDMRYSLFLLFSVLTVFVGAHMLAKAGKPAGKKAVLITILAVNLGLLFFVKYVPYLLKTLGTDGFHILVPVGISFYTLQMCGYLVDVYRQKYPAEKNFLKFLSFSTFFPLMLQGPISRYDQLAHQLFNKEKRTDFYRNYTFGAQLMLWGFFKKLVIADRAALMVNAVFDNYADYSGATVLVAILLYTVQIYADFSGCVDICRGSAQLFGIDLLDNFKRPYFATSIQDFWKRWHISLSSWFRDYLYIPLGGNRKGVARKYVNLLIVFFVSGIWHGVGVHFLVWGLLQGVFQIVGALSMPFRQKVCAYLKINRETRAYTVFQICITFILVNISWLVFRASDTMAAFKMFVSIFRFSAPLSPVGITWADVIVLVAALAVLFAVSLMREKGWEIRCRFAEKALPIRWAILLLVFASIVLFGIYGPGYSDDAFIYMNF